MILKVLSSNSAGNSYVLENDSEALIIECGVRLLKVKKAIGFELNKISGAVLSHSHLDHSGYITEYLTAGIKVYASKETFKERGVTDFPYTVPVEHQRLYLCGNFKIYPFELMHDVKCFGYLIIHPECGSVFFATDTACIPYSFTEINNLIIEANYCNDIVTRLIEEGKLEAWRQRRVDNSHMSIQNVLEYLKKSDTSRLNNIVLIHLSNGSSNEKEFIERVRNLTSKRVFAADKDMIIPFYKTPYDNYSI